MAMTTRRSRFDRLSDINVTPMADIMIVLLIIFMVMTPMITTPPVDLPEAVHGKKRTPTIEIAITRTGAATVAGVPVSDLHALAAVAAERLATAPDSTVVLFQVDHETPYATVAEAIRLMREAGAEEVSLAVDRKVGG